MAHFARLDSANTVVDVIVVCNDVIIDSEGKESESLGVAFCQSLLGAETRWVQTSYNNSFRFQYAAPGCTYRQDLDVFVTPAPFPSWVLNEETYLWESPVPMPDSDEYTYEWDEDTVNWVVTPLPEIPPLPEGMVLPTSPYPTDGGVYDWDQEQEEWVLQ